MTNEEFRMTNECPNAENRMEGREASRRTGVATARPSLAPFEVRSDARKPGGSEKNASFVLDRISAEHTRPTPRHSSFVIPSSSALRPSAFTLLEILVVLGLLMMLFGVSIISISGIKEEDRLRRAVALIETTARDNLLQAVKEQKTITLPLSAGSFGTGSDFSGMLKVRRVGERGFREPKRGETWRNLGIQPHRHLRAHRGPPLRPRRHHRTRLRRPHRLRQTQEPRFPRQVMKRTSPAKACRRIRQNAALRRALVSTPASQGFALLEILLAIALFALVSVGMTQALNGIAQTTTAARQEAQVLRVLESVLAEVAHQPEFKAAKIDFPKTADHIDASATIEKVRLFTRDKAELDHVFRVRAEAWITDGTSRRIVRSMETYVYSPNSPI